MADVFETSNRQSERCCEGWPHRGHWCPVVAATASGVLSARPDLNPAEPDNRRWAYQQAAHLLDVVWTQHNADQYGVSLLFLLGLARTADSVAAHPETR